MTLFFTESDVQSLLPMADAVDVVHEALVELGNQRAINRPRQRIRLAKRMFHVMPAGSDALGYAGLKAYSAGPSGTRFYFFLFDAEKGELVSILEADRLGQIRTGAATGVLTRALAKKTANGLGMIGTGWQARTQLEAVAAVMALKRVLVYGRDRDRRESFCADMSTALGLSVIPVSSPEAVAEMDILVTATSSRTPVLKGEWLREGHLVNAVGSNFAHRRELDDEAMRRAGFIVVDALDQAKIECGDLIQFFESADQRDERAINGWDQVTELGALLADSLAEDRSALQEIQIFFSQGLAIEDVAVAKRVYELGKETGVGRSVLS